MSGPTVATAPERFREAAEPGVRVPVEVRVAAPDPFEAYRRARQSEGGVYLETTGGQSGWGLFAVDPREWLTVGPDDGSSLAALAALLSGEDLVRADCDVPYPCGAFGWLSYDLARELEALPSSARDDRGLPHLQVATYDAVASWLEPRDGDRTTLRVTACPRVAPEESPRRAYERGLARARSLAAAATDGRPAATPPPVDADAATFESETGRASFEERVRRVKEKVRAGETFQANVSHRLVAPAAVHPVDAFAALRRGNPAPYSGLVEFPGVDLVSASPELLLETDGDRVRTEPIAGTRPRGATPAEDRRLAADLRSDEKERAEHAMLVDLERNDLGKVCEFGSVAVEEYRRVDRYSEVMHLVSSVTGRLRRDAGTGQRGWVDGRALDARDAGETPAARRACAAVAAAFPGGTITGAPKPRTMEIIDAVEATRRGPYTGAVGAFGFDGRATLNIVIRTLVRHRKEYHLRVGAGVVHDSVPEREYAETLNKARALVTAVDAALGDRGSAAVEGEP